MPLHKYNHDLLISAFLLNIWTMLRLILLLATYQYIYKKFEYTVILSLDEHLDTGQRQLRLSVRGTATLSSKETEQKGS